MLAEPQQRDQPVSDLHDFPPVIDGGKHPRSQLERFPNRKRRNDVSLIPDTHHQGLNDRQRQRQIDRERGAKANLGFDFDFALKFFDVAFDHVHANATPRNVGHDFGRGKARSENEMENFGIGQFGVRGDQTFLDRLAKDALTAQSVSVILDLNHDVAPLVKRPQVDHTLDRFAPRGAHLRFLNPMIERLPDHVEERIADLLDVRPVQFSHLPA